MEKLRDRGAILETLAKPGTGWRQKIYLEGSVPDDPVHLESPSRRLDFPILNGNPSPNPSQAYYSTDSPRPGYVAFNESYTPGWHAWVDGQPKPILRAYGLFMAVAVGTGEHKVYFHYEPASFRFGLFVSLLVLSAMILGWVKPAIPNGPRGRTSTHKPQD
jgi:hypothetical protein